MSRIEFKAINKRYGKDLPLTIKDATLTIESGEFCVFVGPSGCGKSTLLRMVAGLEEITSGDICIAGERINDLPPAKRGVAMVFQSYALYPHMTVAQNMGFALSANGMDKALVAKKVSEAASILQLTPLLERLPKALSGGQRQRVAIGRAIVKQPRAFLFDEPLSNLDASLRVQTRLEIAKLHNDIGTASMIYVTHDQVEAMTLADKIVLLHTGALVEERGSIAQAGTPMELYHQPASLFVAEFIGSPKMNVIQGIFLRATTDVAIVEVQGKEVRVDVDAQHLVAGSPIHIGIRPEHFVLSDDGEGATIQAVLRHVERVGDISLFYVDVGDAAPKPLTVRVEGSVRPPTGTPLSLRLLSSRLHLFDSNGIACRRTVELPA